MKIKTLFGLGLAAGLLAATAPRAEHWVSIAGTQDLINADTVMITKTEDGKDLLLFQAKYREDGVERFVFIVNCSGTDVHLVTGGGKNHDVVHLPSGTAGGDWRDALCKPYVK